MLCFFVAKQQLVLVYTENIIENLHCLVKHMNHVEILTHFPVMGTAPKLESRNFLSEWIENVDHAISPGRPETA